MKVSDFLNVPLETFRNNVPLEMLESLRNNVTVGTSRNNVPLIGIAPK